MLVGLVLLARSASACPFCSAVSMTFSEEIASSDAAVIAKLVKAPDKPKEDAGAFSGDTGKATFEVVDVLKGAKFLEVKRTFEAVYFGDNPPGTMFLIMGVEPPAINWSTPIAISERARKYLAAAIKLPKEGADRLAFFQDYLQDREDILTRDAYAEFAKAPYGAVKELGPRMQRDKLIAWIRDVEKVPASQRRLYLTMLGVCGKLEDVAVLEEMIKSNDRQTKSGLDALIAAYLTLKGPDGVALIEDLFLKDKDAEYTDTYAAIMALRFHGQEEKTIPRERLLAALRYMLDRPQLADLIIPDLARWEDWSAMDRLVDLFKNADDESSWVRVPVINYLQACPLPEAKKRIEELAKIDPEVVKRANTLFAFGGALAGSRPAAAPASAAKDAASKDKASTGKAENDITSRSGETSAEKAAADKQPAASPKEKPQDAKAAADVGSNADADKTKASAAPVKTKPEAGQRSSTQGSKAGARTQIGKQETQAHGAARLAAADSDILPLSGQLRRTPASPATTVRVLCGLALALVLLFGLFLSILRGGSHAAA